MMNTAENYNIHDEKVKVLKDEYHLKQRRNELYSLRSFARDLGVSHTLLSLIFKGKRRVTDTFSKKVKDNKVLTKKTREVLALGLEREPTPEESFQKLSLEQSEMMSDWIHYAILSLTEIPNFQWNAQWIANRLGTSQNKVKTAMARLKSLDVIEKNSKGQFTQKPLKIVVDNDIAFEAGKKFNKTLLKKASNSMEECDFDKRSISSTTFTLNPKHIPYAISKIKEFRRNLSEELESMDEQEEVYTLSVQLFPLTQISQEKLQ
ncbi:DUF4423 domain-containing protein [Halobacteriovorax sp. GB3]|uniref:DUF4423 domain-containing protein n=1 Tax=Halobacteriovorax sp. GB3 TaxID=2719615 RepID=UPI002362EFE6|nr:DUF4423 domain-containing protein [Halobacteriovorax sp. GB3]MDD0851641.1 DUF4423 domain-containing protein [Halobacteriovorax sp. GB3]